jgi:hypothetical protein
MNLSFNKLAEVITSEGLASFSLLTETPPAWISFLASPFEVNTADFSANNVAASIPSASSTFEMLN